MSLLDRNIDRLNCYNGHFIFTDKSLAEKYMKKDIFTEEDIIERNRYVKECNDFDTLFNEY